MIHLTPAPTRVPFPLKTILITVSITFFLTLDFLHAIPLNLMHSTLFTNVPSCHPQPPPTSTSTQSSFFTSYHPLNNPTTFAERLRHNCKVLLPSKDTITRDNHTDWGFTRFVMYYNLVHTLKTHLNSLTSTRNKLSLLDFGGNRVLNDFPSVFNITSTSWPGVDIHSTPYESGSFDVVAADQVLEHVAFPHLAMAEIHRLLKPGGVGIVTSCAYNPLHTAGEFRDYWRFMVDGMKMLSMGFEGGILGCGGWGSKRGIVARVEEGMGIEESKKLGEMLMTELVKNDEDDPWSTWLVVKK